MEFELTAENLLKLENIFRNRFLDIQKIIGLFNQNQAKEFRRINAAFMQAQLKEEGGDHANHKHDGTDSGCCHSANLRYYMPKERMSTCDKIINEMLFENKNFFTSENHKNLIAILHDVSEAMNHFKAKAKTMGKEVDADMHQKLLTKCLSESPNRYIFNKVREILIK